MSGLIQRYISKELVHFVGKGLTSDEQFDLLLKIMREGWITHAPHSPNISGNLSVNPNVAISKNEMYLPQMTCFADIPVQDLSIHLQKYGSIGISFPKDFIADAGGTPVHYLPRGGRVHRLKNLDAEDYMKLIKQYGQEKLADNLYEDISQGQYFDEMVKDYHGLFRELVKVRIAELRQDPDRLHDVSDFLQRLRQLQMFLDFHVFSYLIFFDHTLPDDDPDNYYFEREWRVVGNVRFEMRDIRTVFFPGEYTEKFRGTFPMYCGQVVFTDQF